MARVLFPVAGGPPIRTAASLVTGLTGRRPGARPGHALQRVSTNVVIRAFRYRRHGAVPSSLTVFPS